MITHIEIQLKRSPQDLREFVINLKNSVRTDKKEYQNGILKKGYYKEFLDEVVPLSIFAHEFYPQNYKIQPILGNQGYDALVFDENDFEVDRIEMTFPQNGSYEAQDAKLVIERGYSNIQICKPGDDLDSLFPFILSTCQNKSIKDYSDCTLVITISPLPPFEQFVIKYDAQINSLLSQLSMIKFNAKRVFLLILPDRILKVNMLK
ncbi:MAG: hypothetical protein JXA06_01540 [Bacteroidetes bacterium]|nr:hypothetical protein [Bacteroidota bacterium]